jgi:glutaconate CoA-transferase subunit A
MTEQIKRKEVIVNEVEAAKCIKDGMSIIIGGFITSSHPMAIIRQVVKNRVRNLTVIGSASSGLDVDLLIGAGCAKKVISPYVGGEVIAPIGPFFRAAAERGQIEVWEIDESMYYCGLRAAAHLLPFMPWRGCVGTSYPKVNPEIKVFQDPLTNETLLAVPAIKPDVAILHAAYSDAYGNVQHIGTGFGDRAQHLAADRTIVQVEKIVPNEEIRKEPVKTSIVGADAVVRVPYGAHPFSSPGFYLEDVEHLKEYVAAANSYTKNGDRSAFERYLEEYIFRPSSHLEYLDKIGVERLFSLYEY